MTLILIEVMLFAVGPRRVFQLWLADPTPILVPIVLPAPQPSRLPLGGVADEARLIDTMPVRALGRRLVVSAG
jgi:hypothetical protein